MKIVSGRLPDFNDEFANARVVHLASTAPVDGTPIVGRNAAGETELIRWRMGTDLEDCDEPYWARYATDEPFDFIEWIPSPLSVEQILKIYE